MPSEHPCNPVRPGSLPESQGHDAREATDIEHTPVADDPRQWSAMRKNFSLVLIAWASMIAGLAGSIQNPAVREMEVDLPATSAQFSWSVAVFILVQGLIPLLWSAISEVKGRKLVYVVSLSLFVLGSIVVAVSKTMQLVIAFRAVQAIGSSAVIAIGAATLADIFDPFERGTKMGIYYMAPLLGPSIGPLLGGALTTGFNWRAIFWFLTVVSGLSVISFVLFFRDTFRRERSLIYQNALRKHGVRPPHTGSDTTLPGSDEKAAVTVSTIDDEARRGCKCDIEAAEVLNFKTPATSTKDVKIGLTDINPIKPILLVLRRKNNALTLFSSGLLFAYNFLIPYTSARTLSAHYGYEALKIGLVVLSYGIGCLLGSIVGGRLSDYQLARLKAKNKGLSQPEMRLHSTLIPNCLLPACIIGFGWVSQKHLHVAVICVFLFLNGFLSICVYSSTLAYIVDANNGRSSSAVACNSAFRGGFAFVAIEIAVPMQDNLGDGWMLTVWGGIIALSGVMSALVFRYGRRWREEGELTEAKTSEEAS